MIPVSLCSEYCINTCRLHLTNIIWRKVAQANNVSLQHMAFTNLSGINYINRNLSFQWAKYFYMPLISYSTLRSDHSLAVIWSHNWPSPNTYFKDHNRKRNYVQIINSYNSTGRSINNTQSIWMLFQHLNMTLMASILWLAIYKKEKT